MANEQKLAEVANLLNKAMQDITGLTAKQLSALIDSVWAGTVDGVAIAQEKRREITDSLGELYQKKLGRFGTDVGNGIKRIRDSYQ